MMEDSNIKVYYIGSLICLVISAISMIPTSKIEDLDYIECKNLCQQYRTRCIVEYIEIPKYYLFESKDIRHLISIKNVPIEQLKVVYPISNMSDIYMTNTPLYPGEYDCYYDIEH